jgi:protein-disulfide isomerase
MAGLMRASRWSSTPTWNARSAEATSPILKRWIDAHPEVNWQWHHLPLAMHEPEATAGARLAECVGAAGGQAAFWQALKWVYANTRGDGQGLPEGLTLS